MTEAGIFSGYVASRSADIRSGADPRRGGNHDAPFQKTQAARRAGLCRSRLSVQRQFPAQGSFRYGERRPVGSDRHHLPAFLAGTGVQLQEARQRGRPGVADRAGHHHGDDVHRVHGRQAARLDVDRQRFSGRHAVDVVDDDHHQGVRRSGAAQSAVHVARVRRASGRRPVRGRADGALFDAFRPKGGGRPVRVVAAFPFRFLSGAVVRRGHLSDSDFPQAYPALP